MGDTTVVWLKNSNQYLVVEALVADLLEELQAGIKTTTLAQKLTKITEAPLTETTEFITELETLLNSSSTRTDEALTQDIPKQFDNTVFYQINDLVLKVDFESEYELALIHPKFAHLEINTPKEVHHSYQVFSSDSHLFFYRNQQSVGSWTKKNSHYFQGKFSMKLIEDTHQFPENEWMGIFHASAVSNGKESILFLGDSGNGKSTSLALLQAHGFQCLADDFVPILAKNHQVYSFPSAISIKRNSVTVLRSFYPTLENKAEFHFPKVNKIVRYLPPNNDNYKQNRPCHTLVFIKYTPDELCKLTAITKQEALQQLVPDSWLCPEESNAQEFLNWFENLSCYQLHYSNNEQMITKVQKLFNHDL